MYQVRDYLWNRKQIKVNNSYKDWVEFVFGVLQGSILSLLLLNIFLADLFFALDHFDIAIFSNSHTPYVYWFRCIQVIESLDKPQFLCFNGLKKILWKVKLTNVIFLPAVVKKQVKMSATLKWKTASLRNF